MKSIFELDEEFFQSEIIVVSDFFSDNLIGGAELTLDSLLSYSDKKIFKIRSKDLKKVHFDFGRSKYWIFGNYTQCNPQLLKAVSDNSSYSVIEFDYKYCIHRNPEEHDCDCEKSNQGNFVIDFYKNADRVFFMSELQLQHYQNKFENFSNTSVLSSIFTESDFRFIQNLRESEKQYDVAYYNSQSKIKGTKNAVEYVKQNFNNTHKCLAVSGLDYSSCLKEMSKVDLFVYLPEGPDTCPRSVIEARLLGCNLVTNSNVQHREEAWFQGTYDEIESYIKSSAQGFWDFITSKQSPTLSGYTTVYNCIEGKYPYIESIISLLRVCDEVIVVDGGSTDGTFEELQALAKDEEKLKIFQNKKDWSSKDFARFDGEQKAFARSKCTSDFCWQQDSDEVISKCSFEKIKNSTRAFPKSCDLICFPVVEFWGSKDVQRLDITPWKWRLSRNKPHITHGVPVTHRKVLADGTYETLPGTDGCDYVHSDTAELIPFLNFYNQQAEMWRQAALMGDEESYALYKNFFQRTIDALPTVVHYSWLDIERKIRAYKTFWGRFWKSMYNLPQEDTSEENVMFDKPWSEVSDEDIKELAMKLKTQTAGWIWHRKWNGQSVPGLHLNLENHE